jgi:hypothetical protein
MERTFEINEGFYRAKLTDIIPTVRNKSNGAQQWRRFLWEVQVPGIRYKQAMAGRNFPFTLDPGSDLRNFLQTWLGKQYFELNGGKTIDLDSLIDMECELELVHFTGKGYSTPMTFVSSAHRVGTLELTEEAVAEKDNN